MSSETTVYPTVTKRMIHMIPTILTFGALAAVAWWGHHTGWQLAKPSFETPSSATAHWCNEHHVPETDCLLCKKPLGKEQANKEPAHLLIPGEEIRFAQVASAEALTKAGIMTATVDVTELAPRLRVAAETVYMPESVARLGSRVAGSLHVLAKRLGDSVQQGDIIAIVESADVGRAKSALMQALSDQTATSAVLQRMQASAAGGFRTTAEVDEAAAHARAATIAVFDAEQNLRNIGLPLKENELAKLTPQELVTYLRRLGLPTDLMNNESANLLPVRAPRAGVITELHAVVGEQIEVGAPIAVIADTSALWLQMPLSSKQAARLEKGHVVQFIPSDGGPEATGSIVVITQAADPITRLVTAWAHMDNAHLKMRVHQFGNAQITTGKAITAATVPTTSIQFDGQQAFIFVQRSPTIFRSLPVDILARDGSLVAVSRLQKDDVVAITNTVVLFSATFPERMGAGCTDD